MLMRSVGTYRRLIRYAVVYWRGWTVIVIVTLLSTVFSLLQPWPMKVLIDHVLGDAKMPAGLSVVVSWLPGASSTVGLLAWVVAAGPFSGPFAQTRGRDRQKLRPMAELPERAGRAEHSRGLVQT
jgi:hypothetical protein